MSTLGFGFGAFLGIWERNDSWSLISFKESIVSVGDPKKKYTRFEKIGQGLVQAFSFPKEIINIVCVCLYLINLVLCLPHSSPISVKSG